MTSDHHSTDVAGAAYYAREATFDPGGEDPPSPAEYAMDPEPPIVFPRCPAAEARAGYAWQCADPSCRGGICVRAEATRLAGAGVAR